MVEIDEGPALAALSCGKAAFLVVLLHGSGADGQAMIDHALNWAPTLPKAEFLALEAPFASGGTGRQWFDSSNADVETMVAALDRRLDEALAKRRLPPSHLALVGFSDGATLALRVGLGRRDQIAAIVAFSGGLADPAALAAGVAARPPTLLVHGEDDTIAPIASMLAAEAALAAVGAPVQALRRPGLGHAIDDDGVIAAGDFLTAHVAHKHAEHEDH